MNTCKRCHEDTIKPDYCSTCWALIAHAAAQFRWCEITRDELDAIRSGAPYLIPGWGVVDPCSYTECRT
jgi:predicted amidophosphoribosyltransferase